MACRITHYYYPILCFFDAACPFSAANTNHKKQEEVEHSGDVFAECLLLAIAVCVNLALLGGTIRRIPFLFLPWMLVYGFEAMAGWAVTLSFLLLPSENFVVLVILTIGSINLSFDNSTVSIPGPQSSLILYVGKLNFAK